MDSLLSPSGKYLAFEKYGKLFLWETKYSCLLDKRSCADRLHFVCGADPVHSLEFICDRALAVGTSTGEVWFWDIAEKGTAPHTLKVGDGAPVFSLSHCRGILAVGSQNGLLTVWDVERAAPPQMLFTHHTGKYPPHVDVTRWGQLVLMTYRSVMVWRIRDWKLLLTEVERGPGKGASRRSYKAKLSPDSKRLAYRFLEIGAPGSTFVVRSVFNPQTEVLRFDNDRLATEMRFVEAGGQVVHVWQNLNGLKTIYKSNIATGSTTEIGENAALTVDQHISDAGHEILVHLAGGKGRPEFLEIWEGALGPRTTKHALAGTEEMRLVATCLSPDGARAAAWTRDRVIIWDTKTKRRIQDTPAAFKKYGVLHKPSRFSGRAWMEITANNETVLITKGTKVIRTVKTVDWACNTIAQAFRRFKERRRHHRWLLEEIDVRVGDEVRRGPRLMAFELKRGEELGLFEAATAVSTRAATAVSPGKKEEE